METPIADFVRRYADSGMIRAHMPGHKGKPFLGCEALDITEIRGADSLYEADGMILYSESHAGELFGSGRTVYSTEGSSQCIRAMLYLVLTCGNGSRTVVAARNVHRSFVYAAALLDFEIVWLWPECSTSLCGCPVSAETLERALATLPAPPAAVYLTSPDYLGSVADISALAEVCRKYGTLLAVDNAHGAYLRFLEPSCHPLDLGADLCCDSAHKTLPVLTGGLWLGSGYATEPLRTGDVIAAVASSASVLYYSDVVTYEDNRTEQVEILSLPCPVFAGGEKLVMQRGAGLCVVKSTPEREKACMTFLKWLNEPERNVALATALGYMPVTKAGFDRLLPAAIETLEDPMYVSLYEAFLQTRQEYTFYVPPQREDYLSLETRFEKTARLRLTAGRAQYLEQGADALAPLLRTTLAEVQRSYDK